jgi:hypothetical protein
MIMNHQNIWVWKEVAVTSFKALSMYLCRDCVKLQTMPKQPVTTEIKNPVPPEYLKHNANHSIHLVPKLEKEWS